jgi:hypothetical protein
MAIRAAQAGVSELGRSAAYVQRLSDLRFGGLSTIHMDATCLTAVGSFNGILIRQCTEESDRHLAEENDAQSATNEDDDTSWETELADPYEDDEPVQPLEKILVFDFGRLSRKLRAVSVRALTNERSRGQVLCYPSGQTLSRLQSSGHMMMDPYDIFDDYFVEYAGLESDDSYDTQAWWDGIGGPHGRYCTCGEL